MKTEKVFVDTCVLLEATDEGRPFHPQALAVLSDFAKRNWSLHCNAQVLREYLVVATRPLAANGLGLPVNVAVANARQLRKRVTLVLEPVACMDTLLAWAERHETKGKKLHDLQILVAACHGGMDILLTGNSRDFPPAYCLRILPLHEL